MYNIKWILQKYGLLKMSRGINEKESGFTN